MTTPPTLQAIKERDAQFTVLDMKWSGTPPATTDRRHLLNLVERMRPYVEWAHDHCDPANRPECAALLKELST